MRAWLMVALLAGSSLGAGAQTTSIRAPELPSAPTPGSRTALSSAAVPADPPAVVPVKSPSYTPLTAHQKFHIFVEQTYSVYTFANTAFDAGWAQMTDDWPAYGQGAEGYGKRYGALLANHEAGSFFENFLFPTVLHQDPRYFRRGGGHSVFQRVSYAASRVLVTHADDGHNTFNSSLLLGMLFVDSLTNAYYPQTQRGLGDTMSRFGGGLLSSAETNLLREFGPDMMRIFHRHEPEKLKRLEELEKKVPLANKLSPPADGTVQSPATPSGSVAPPASLPAPAAGRGSEGSTTSGPSPSRRPNN
ncbi:MAG TPA: hypothetical protein VKT29_01570 [Terriglobales bacterium]|nr:hypothetical protein [Terriglobales bacterium]